MKDILAELREIERQVLARVDRGEGDAHTRGAAATSASLKGNVGSISYSGTTKRGSRPGGGGGRARPSAPRLPSFEGKVHLSSSFLGGAASANATDRKIGHALSRDESESEDDGEALLALAEADVPIDETEESATEYSTSVLKPRSTILARTPAEADDRVQRPYGTLGSNSGSTLAGTAQATPHNRSGSLPSLPPSWVAAHGPERSASQAYPDADEDEGTRTIMATSSLADAPSRKLSYLTARTSTLSIANAVVGQRKFDDNDAAADDEDEAEEARDVFHSAFQHPPPTPLVTSSEPIEAPHRFSLIKPGLQRFLGSFSPYLYSSSSLAVVANGFGAEGGGGGGASGSASGSSSGPSARDDKRTAWDVSNKLESGQAYTSGVATGKCTLCTKKLGLMKAYLACDDCGSVLFPS